jgi:hypothetical protein
MRWQYDVFLPNSMHQRVLKRTMDLDMTVSEFIREAGRRYTKGTPPFRGKCHGKWAVHVCISMPNASTQRYYRQIGNGALVTLIKELLDDRSYRPPAGTRRPPKRSMDRRLGDVIDKIAKRIAPAGMRDDYKQSLWMRALETNLLAKAKNGTAHQQRKFMHTCVFRLALNLCRGDQRVKANLDNLRKEADLLQVQGADPETWMIAWQAVAMRRTG